MRPSIALLVLVVAPSLLVGYLTPVIVAKRQAQEKNIILLQAIVSTLGLSDLALSTEARYTRHPAVSDPVVVFMDHPGAIDHFPSTLFWAR